jgi:hypothetical protein
MMNLTQQYQRKINQLKEIKKELEMIRHSEVN